MVILLLGLTAIIGAYLILTYVSYLTISQGRVIVTSWRPILINGLYQCPNGYSIGPLNRSGYYPCGPCLIIVKNEAVNLTCPG